MILVECVETNDNKFFLEKLNKMATKLFADRGELPRIQMNSYTGEYWQFKLEVSEMNRNLGEMLRTYAQGLYKEKYG